MHFLDTPGRSYRVFQTSLGFLYAIFWKKSDTPEKRRYQLPFFYKQPQNNRRSYGMKLFHTECLKELKKTAAASVDAVVTDPPYGIGIFGSRWDRTLPDEEIWRECHRVLKPGGFILAFSSPRLYHRLAVAMEGAGFGTHNMLAWLYGTSVPKGCNISLQFDKNDGVPVPDDAFRKYLRDAVERGPYTIQELEKMCGTSHMFRHYLSQSQAAYPTLANWKIIKKALDLDGTYDPLFARIEKLRRRFGAKKEGRGTGRFGSLVRDFAAHRPKSPLAKKWEGWRCGRACPRSCMEPIYMGQKRPLRPIRENVARHGTGAVNIGGCWTVRRDGKKHSPSSAMHDGSEAVRRILEKDAPTASLSLNEFFFVPKPGKKERDGNPHPTAKPVALMRHLVRLVTPPGGIVLDPFMGSGTTALAARAEGMDFIGMEREGEFFETARRRLEGANP